MGQDAKLFTIGIEKKYILVDQKAFALANAPDSLIDACQKKLADKVNPEFLPCQIEIGTGVCHTIAEARADLAHLRRTVARHGAEKTDAPKAVVASLVSVLQVDL